MVVVVRARLKGGMPPEIFYELYVMKISAPERRLILYVLLHILLSETRCKKKAGVIGFPSDLLLFDSIFSKESITLPTISTIFRMVIKTLK